MSEPASATTEAKQKCVCILGKKGWPVCDKPFVDIAEGANACCNEIAGTICEHDEACHPTNTPKPITQ